MLLEMPFDNSPRIKQISLPATSVAVREALCQLFSKQTEIPLPSEACDRAQIVLAEALNNVVKHAYAHCDGGIEVHITFFLDYLECHIIDHGQPIPDDIFFVTKRPAIPPHTINGTFSELPEGGFGWHLIKTLSHNLRYTRHAGKNQLSFSISRISPLTTKPHIK